MSNEEKFEEDLDIMVLVDEEGAEHEFELIAEMEIEDNEYRVLVPIDEKNEESEEVEVVILKVVNDEDGAEFLADIEDDEEWEMVADAWQELVDSEEV